MGVVNAILADYIRELGSNSNRLSTKLPLVESSLLRSSDPNEFSPLGIAILENQVEVARILIQAQIDLEHGYQNCGSALELAISHCQTEIVDLLLD